MSIYNIYQILITYVYLTESQSNLEQICVSIHQILKHLAMPVSAGLRGVMIATSLPALLLVVWCSELSASSWHLRWAYNHYAGTFPDTVGESNSPQCFLEMFAEFPKFFSKHFELHLRYHQTHKLYI